jgi:hypothetical protein
LSFWVTSSSCYAATLYAPVGGTAVSLPEGRVLCGVIGGGWQTEPNAISFRPPADTGQIGKVTQVRVASSVTACTTSKDSIALVVTGPFPLVERHSIDLWLDEGRLELHGTNLDGTRLDWETKDERGSDVCVASNLPGGQQSCSYLVSKKLPADITAVSLRLFPAGVTVQGEFYDAAGDTVKIEAFSLVPSRTLITSSLVRENHVDLSTGEDHLLLRHWEAVASADCDSGRCELVEQGIRVRGITSSAHKVTLKLRLAPRVFARNLDTFTQSISVPLDITYCPLTVVSASPMRDTDDVRVVVRGDARCIATPESIRVKANGNPVPVLDVETKDGYVYTLLGIGRVTTERLILAVMRGSTDSSVIGLTSVSTVPPPQLLVSLYLEGFGAIDFIPTNRDATVSVTAPNLRGKIVPLPIIGVYTLKEQSGRVSIRGDTNGGFVVMRFALRDETLPGHFAQVDLAHFNGIVQRAVKEVNVAAPIGFTESKNPIAEVLCTDPTGHSIVVVRGVPLHIPFAQRDGCRLVIHRSQIPVEDGEQRLNVTVDVSRVDGATRPEGHFTQRLFLRHGSEPRVIWIHGVKSQFDRITVRLTHVIDDSQYMRAGGEQVEVPAGQWTVVVENTRFRFYATAAIPLQLFRFSNDSGGSGTGPLSLNLGVLSRFTWVTRDGTEGVLGLENGVMGMGLAANNTRQLNIVSGLGLSVPLGNTGQTSQASMNIHAWVAYRLGNEVASRLDGSGNPISGEFVNLNHWSFIFGPSVSFGNLGIDL